MYSGRICFPNWIWSRSDSPLTPSLGWQAQNIQCSESRICGFLWRQSLQPSVLEENVAKKMQRLKPRRTSRHRGGQVGSHNSAGGSCCWPGMAWGHLVSPVWGLWCLTGPNTMRQVSIIQHSRLWRQHRGHLQMCGERSPQITRWRGRHAAELPHTSLLWATSTKLAGVYNSGSMKIRGQSHGSGAWLSVVGLMPFINNICDFKNICDFCPGSYFLNPDCHSDLPQMWCNFCI